MSSSRLMNGMVFKRGAEGEVKKVANAKIAVFTCPFDVTQTETKVGLKACSFCFCTCVTLDLNRNFLALRTTVYSVAKCYCYATKTYSFIRKAKVKDYFACNSLLLS